LGLVLLPAPGDLAGWPFAGYETFHSCHGVRSTRLLRWKTVASLYQHLAYLQLPRTSSTGHIRQLLLYSSASSKEWKMSQHTINNSANFSNNNNSFNVQNNYSFVDDRSQLLAWLSPLEPKLRHQDIRERRVENVGEWLMQTEEFRSWQDCRGDDKGVLFCYGAPGVGKTFIR